MLLLAFLYNFRVELSILAGLWTALIFSVVGIVWLFRRRLRRLGKSPTLLGDPKRLSYVLPLALACFCAALWILNFGATEGYISIASLIFATVVSVIALLAAIANLSSLIWPLNWLASGAFVGAFLTQAGYIPRVQGQGGYWSTVFGPVITPPGLLYALMGSLMGLAFYFVIRFGIGVRLGLKGLRPAD